MEQSVLTNSVNMDESFTRSLYIGRDKMAEVIKRREAAEAERIARLVIKI